LIQSELNEAEAKSRRTGKPARRFKIQKKNALNYLGAGRTTVTAAINEGMFGSDEVLRSDDDNRLAEVVRAKGTIGEKQKPYPANGARGCAGAGRHQSNLVGLRSAALRPPRSP
jgi:hypothetical protein